MRIRGDVFWKWADPHVLKSAYSGWNHLGGGQ